jgi:hypothetical protein
MYIKQMVPFEPLQSMPSCMSSKLLLCCRRGIMTQSAHSLQLQCKDSLTTFPAQRKQHAHRQSELIHIYDLAFCKTTTLPKHSH